MKKINDFKLVNTKAENMFYNFKNYKELENKLNKKENPKIEKRRYGFYLLILAHITQITDPDILSECIIDTAFNKLFFGTGNNDYGIDAVYIDEELKCINLFNFKFRETFKLDSTRKLRDLNDCAKFISFFNVEKSKIDDIKSNSKKTATILSKIRKKFNEGETWNLKLYLVSNDNNPIREKESVYNFKITHGIDDIIEINLDEIISFIIPRTYSINASLSVEDKYLLTYSADQYSTDTSFLINATVMDLIKITCDNSTIREQVDLSEYSDIFQSLKNTNLDFNVLHDNVRGFLGEKKRINKNICNTLRDDPSSFFLYNNGITILAERIEVENRKYQKRKIKISNFQVVNGGQTLRSIHSYLKNSQSEDFLSNARVLIRIFNIKEDEQKLKIAEFTNSQNAVSTHDLKSITSFQINLESFLKEKEIKYIRKAGDLGSINEIMKDWYKIDIKLLAQIIYSSKGHPYQSASSTAKLFNEYYQNIFSEGENPIMFDEIYDLIVLYKELEDFYRENNYRENNKYKLYKNKLLYLICLKTLNKKIKTEELVAFFEDHLKSYPSDKHESRKIQSKDFQDYIISNFKIYSKIS